MSSKFASSRRPQQPPKVCKKAPVSMPAAAELWPLPHLSAFAGVAFNPPPDKRPISSTFPITETFYPLTWEGWSAPTGHRLYVHATVIEAPNIFQFTLTLYQDDTPLNSFYWHNIQINLQQPFNSRLLYTKPPLFNGLAVLMITE